jgi:hypothetical protein
MNVKFTSEISWENGDRTGHHAIPVTYSIDLPSLGLGVAEGSVQLAQTCYIYCDAGIMGRKV